MPEAVKTVADLQEQARMSSMEIKLISYHLAVSASVYADTGGLSAAGRPGAPGDAGGAVAAQPAHDSSPGRRCPYRDGRQQFACNTDCT